MRNTRSLVLFGTLITHGLLPCVVRAQVTETAADSLERLENLLIIDSTSEVESLVRAAEESGPLTEGRSRDRPRGVRIEFTQQLSRRLDLGRGYGAADSGSSTYAGSPLRVLATARVSVGSHFTLRFAGEKDAGEPCRIAGGIPAPDFVSATASVSDLGVIESMIVGDYVAHWGWGLIVGRPSFTTGARPPRPRSSKLAPYRGFNESAFLRGIGATLRVGRWWKLSGFASRRRVDARLDSLRSGESGYSLTVADGLHRTDTERFRRNTLSLDVAGGFVRARAGPLDGGVGGYVLRLSHRVLSGPRPDQKYGFAGASQWGASTFARLNTRQARTSAEVAIVDGELSGVVLGSLLPVSPAWRIWVYYRRLRCVRQSLLGSVPQRRSGQPAEEGGVTFGLRFRLRGKAELSVAYDTHWFDSIRFGLQTPTDGRSLAMAFKMKGTGSEVEVRTSMRQAHRSNLHIDTSGVQVRGGGPSRTWRTSLLARTLVRRRLAFEIRFASAVGRDRSGRLDTGHIVAFDFHVEVGRWLDMRGRLALFGSASGESRVYAYEPGLSHDFSIPSFSGEGERRYIVVQLRPVAWMSTRVKYSSSRWPGSASVGSGLEETAGDRIRAVGVELRISI